MHVTLERALMLTNADMGSVLILDKSEPKSFVVKASLGLGDFIKLDDRIEFETSIAKYAIINKTPLLVEDIEQERRFGRTNRLHYGTKSFVIMPIKTIKDVIGVLTISRRDTGTVFSQTEVEALTPLLSNAAFTYENIRLLKQLEAEKSNMSSIRKTFKALNSSMRDNELFHAILAEVQEAIPFEIAAILTREDKQADQLTVTDIIANKTCDITIGEKISLNGCIVDKTIQQESVQIIEDLSSLDQELDRKLFLDHGLKSCILTPLIVRGEVSGVMVLFAENADPFQDKLDIMESITNIVSFAFEESKLSASVFKRNQELIAIKQIGSVLASSTFDIKQVLNYTMEMIKVLMNVEAGSLSLVKNDLLEFAVAFEIDVEQLQKFQLKMGQGISGAVAARGTPIIENEASNSSYFYPAIDEKTNFKTRSVLCVPMISQGKVIGVIEVLNKRQGLFTNDDKDILQSIATSVSIALENARLYEETVSMAEHERGIRAMFQKFVPKEIIDKIIHGSETGKEVIDEFKTITLLNIDIRGFSKLTKQIGPQKSVAMLNHFFSIMGGIVFNNSGIVDKYLGDGFLALFGAPVSTPMDAENAVTAALEMQAAVELINQDYIKNILDSPLSIGVSIYTGEVVVGNIGFEMKMDYTVIGDPVNNVFRLQEQTKAVPNSIILSESTSRAVLTPLELKELKSTVGSMKAYELLGRKET